MAGSPACPVRRAAVDDALSLVADHAPHDAVSHERPYPQTCRTCATIAELEAALRREAL